jgi:hypothetical protein
MTNYLIEGNFDFYNELYKSLDQPETNNESDNLCLITNLPLTDKYVTLACNHKFNYIPLFNDLVVRKSKSVTLDTQHLGLHEIRCPYCRAKDTKLLPYYEDIGVEKVHGVNYVDPEKVINKSTACENWTSQFFSGNCNYIFVTGYNTPVPCKCTMVTTFDGKTYCYHHNKLMKKKEQAKKKKEDLKLKSPEVKVKKLAKKGVIIDLTNDENVVISNTGCVQILKTGPRKGQPCCNKKTNGDLCTRHFNLQK